MTAPTAGRATTPAPSSAPATTSAGELAVDLQDVVKTFGTTRALDGLTLTVPVGQVHGFLGPNGAGKSTTIRILLGLLRADSGRARLLGGDPWSQAPDLHRWLAYVPGDVSLWPNLSGGEAIDLLLRAHQGGRGRGRAERGNRPERRGRDGLTQAVRSRRDELIDRFDLDPRKKGRSYSKGNRQKVALIAALATDAELLLLDEPTSGLDPLMERVFTDLITEERDRGRTVLLSSHILSEVEALCDHVSIIRAGRIVETGTLAQLRHLTRTQVSAELAGRVPADLAHVRGVHDVRTEDSPAGMRVTMQVDDSALTGVLEELARVGVRSLTSTPPTLEELFLRHYEGR